MFFEGNESEPETNWDLYKQKSYLIFEAISMLYKLTNISHKFPPGIHKESYKLKLFRA